MLKDSSPSRACTTNRRAVKAVTPRTHGKGAISGARYTDTAFSALRGGHLY